MSYDIDITDDVIADEIKIENKSESITEDEFIVEENILVEPSIEEVKQVLEDLKIELTPEDKAKYEKKKPGRKASAKKDIPTPNELDSMTDQEVEENAENVGDEVRELYLEFSSFMEDKAKIKSDDGIKETIPTGINLLDAAMGGGFAIGTLSMILGSPGCGKCSFYDEEIEIYVYE